jgi:F-type H+-transporting ATPase subunit delta
MADNITIARPYAKALFALALEQETLLEWSDMLKSFALIASDKQVVKLLRNPMVAKSQLADVFKEIGSKSNADGKRLIDLLAAKNRLAILPAISALFDQSMADYANTMTVKVMTAYPLDQERVEKLQHALERHLKREVTMDCVIDHSILGGVVIYAGNQVIDRSLRGRLERLSESLCS